MSGYLLSGVLTGLFLIGTIVILARNRDWRDYSPARDTRDRPATLQRVAASPTSWIAGFLLLALGLGLGALVVVGAVSVPAGLKGAAGPAMVAALLATLGGYVFLGVYNSIRYRGLYRSHAAAAGIWVLATLAVVGVAVMLVTAG